jgi:hypothetical protein
LGLFKRGGNADGGLRNLQLLLGYPTVCVRQQEARCFNVALIGGGVHLFRCKRLTICAALHFRKIY